MFVQHLIWLIYTKNIAKSRVGWGGVGLEKRYKGGFGHKEMCKEGGLKLSAQSVLTIEGNVSFDI